MRIRYPAYEMVAADRRSGGRGVRIVRDRKKDRMSLSASDERTALMAVAPDNGPMSRFRLHGGTGTPAEILESPRVSRSGAA